MSQGLPHGIPHDIPWNKWDILWEIPCDRLSHGMSLCDISRRSVYPKEYPVGYAGINHGIQQNEQPPWCAPWDIQSGVLYPIGYLMPYPT